jgi:hypothetical protein
VLYRVFLKTHAAQTAENVFKTVSELEKLGDIRELIKLLVY